GEWGRRAPAQMYGDLDRPLGLTGIVRRSDSPRLSQLEYQRLSRMMVGHGHSSGRGARRLHDVGQCGRISRDIGLRLGLGRTYQERIPELRVTVGQIETPEDAPSSQGFEYLRDRTVEQQRRLVEPMGGERRSHAADGAKRSGELRGPFEA